MLPVSRGLMDRDRELDALAGVHPNLGGAPAAVRGMKRGDPEPDGQTAAALVDSTGAECKRPRIDGSGGIEVGQVRRSSGVSRSVVNAVGWGARNGPLTRLSRKAMFTLTSFILK